MDTYVSHDEVPIKAPHFSKLFSYLWQMAFRTTFWWVVIMFYYNYIKPKVKDNAKCISDFCLDQYYVAKKYQPFDKQINTLRPRRNGHNFTEDIFKCIFFNENILIQISLKSVPKDPINNIMAWRRPGDKPLSEPMMVILLTHIYVTRPQWVINFSSLNCSCIHIY